MKLLGLVGTSENLPGLLATPTDQIASPPQLHVKLEVNNFSFFYGDRQILRNISITIVANSVTAFIGASGCGKSTLLRSFNRIHEAAKGWQVQGQIRLDGEDIYGMDPTILRRRVGMIFQKPNLFPKSIFDNVAYGITLFERPKRRELAERVEIALHQAFIWNEVKDKLRKSAFALSGGQQQRLCIARALAVRPEVLLMDEPCSALDPIATGHIEDLILTLKEQCTILIVTHNMQQASRVADLGNTGYLDTHDEVTKQAGPGQLIEFSPTRDLMKNPRHPRTEGFITGRFG